MTPARLLLADDDGLVLTTLAKGLRSRGYQVVAVETGEQALERAAEQPFDLAVLDIRMPGISGIETARRLRETHGLHSLFLSAYDDQELVKQAVADGGLGYLVKPVDVPQLVPSLEAALARARDLEALIKNKEQLEQALAGSRHASTAIGILMERRGLSQQAAFETLRTRARSGGRKLDEVARELVEAAEGLNTV